MYTLKMHSSDLTEVNRQAVRWSSGVRRNGKAACDYQATPGRY